MVIIIFQVTLRNNKILRGGFDAGGNIDINFSFDFESSNNLDNLTSDLSIPSNEGDFINPAALDSNQDVYLFMCLVIQLES